MAKKKGKPQPRKSKKKRASSFMSSVKKMLLGAFAVVVCFIGVLFIYNWFYPVSKTRPVEKKQDRAETIVRPNISDKGGSGTSGKKAAQATKNKQTTNPKKETTAYTFQEGAEIPISLLIMQPQAFRWPLSFRSLRLSGKAGNVPKRSGSGNWPVRR